MLAELPHLRRLRKVSDVPVGVFLSGGVDSSANAALFAEGRVGAGQDVLDRIRRRLPELPNEFAYARQVADRVGAEHHELRLSLDDLIDFLPRMAALLDEPIADPVSVPVYYVSKLARDNGVVVAQVGEGADELFFGYPRWRTRLRLQRADDLPLPRAVKRAGVALAGRVGRSSGFETEYLRRGASGQPIFWGGAETFTQQQKERLLAPAVRSELGGLSSWDILEPIRRRFEAGAPDTSHLNWMTYADLNLRLPELLLMRIDKMAMAVGPRRPRPLPRPAPRRPRALDPGARPSARRGTQAPSSSAPSGASSRTRCSTVASRGSGCPCGSG